MTTPVSMTRAKPEMNRELPSLFCHTCLRWIVTRDKYNGLARLNGKLTLVTIWTPECSKEV